MIDVVMNQIAQSRQRYLKDNIKQFKSDAGRRGYLSDWVANYEISDFLRQED